MILENLHLKDDINWVNAMKHEIDALEANDTWELKSLPARKKAIVSKWVYKLKLKPDGTTDRYKACLVVKGYQQIMCIDFFDSFPSSKIGNVSFISYYCFP